MSIRNNHLQHMNAQQREAIDVVWKDVRNELNDCLDMMQKLSEAIAKLPAKNEQGEDVLVGSNNVIVDLMQYYAKRILLLSDIVKEGHVETILGYEYDMLNPMVIGVLRRVGFSVRK